MPTRQEKWDLKARKAGYIRRQFFVHDYLNQKMEEYVQKHSEYPGTVSKSKIVHKALTDFFEKLDAESSSSGS